MKVKEWQFATLLLLGFIWGSSFILMKLGLRSFSAIELALLRISFSFLFLLPFMIPRFKKIPKDRYIYLLFAGLLGNGIPAFMFAIGLQKIDSSLGGILNATTPLFTLIVGALFFSLNFKRSGLFGILIGLAGTVYLILSKGRNGENSDYFFALFPLIGSICYGFSTNIIKRDLKYLTPIEVTGGALTFIGPITIISLIFTGTFQHAFDSRESLESLFFIIILGVFSTSVAVLIFNFLIKETTVLFAASVTYLVPMFAMIWGILFQEPVTFHYFIAMLLILAGVYLTNRS